MQKYLAKIVNIGKRSLNRSNKNFFLSLMPCVPAKREWELPFHIHIFHSIFPIFSLPTQPSIHPPTSFFNTIGKFQIPFLITDAFQSVHHYIFQPISFKMYWKPLCWFPRVPFFSSVMLLLVCFSCSLLGDPHCYSFSVSLTSVWMAFIWPIPCSLHYLG